MSLMVLESRPPEKLAPSICLIVCSRMSSYPMNEERFVSDFRSCLQANFLGTSHPAHKC
jgi:hypothetical protein